jgi:hypothetical protein
MHHPRSIPGDLARFLLESTHQKTAQWIQRGGGRLPSGNMPKASLPPTEVRSELPRFRRSQRDRQHALALDERDRTCTGLRRRALRFTSSYFLSAA